MNEIGHTTLLKTISPIPLPAIQSCSINAKDGCDEWMTLQQISQGFTYTSHIYFVYRVTFYSPNFFHIGNTTPTQNIILDVE